MGTLQELEERVDELENELHKHTTWVRYFDTDYNKWMYGTIAFCERLSIPYLPTEYSSAFEARTGRLKPP